MADSLRLQILDAFEAALRQETVTVGGKTWDTPSPDLRRHNPRPESVFPSMAVGVGEGERYAEKVEYLGMGPTYETELLVDVTTRVASTDPPERACDSFIIWSDVVAAANPTLGGLALHIHPVATAFAQDRGNPSYASSVRTYSVRYCNKAGNPTTAF